MLSCTSSNQIKKIIREFYYNKFVHTNIPLFKDIRQDEMNGDSKILYFWPREFNFEGTIEALENASTIRNPKICFLFHFYNKLKIYRCFSLWTLLFIKHNHRDINIIITRSRRWIYILSILSSSSSYEENYK